MGIRSSIRPLLAAAGLFLLTFPSASGALTLPEAVDAALATHPSIAARQALQAEAWAAVGEARADWFPSLRVSGSLTQYEEPMAVFPIHGFNPQSLPPFDETLAQGGVSLSYTLFDGAGRIGRVRQARARAGAADKEALATEQSLIAWVTNAYLAVLNAQETLAAHDHHLAALERERARVQQLLAVGRAAEIQVLQAEAALAGARAERVRIAGTLDRAEQEMARLTGRALATVRAAPFAAFTLPGEPGGSLARDDLLAAALAENAGLQAARQIRQAADAGVLAACSARWPKLIAAGSYLGWADGDGHDTWEWNAGLQLAWPLFAGGAIRHSIERARAARQGAGAALALAELRVGEQIDRALTAIDETRARVTSLEAAVAAQAEVARIQQLLLEAGSGTESDYLDAEADLLTGRAALADARHGELAACVELARVTGRLDQKWIRESLQ